LEQVFVVYGSGTIITLKWLTIFLQKEEEGAGGPLI
jgi:hypothetical protein